MLTSGETRVQLNIKSEVFQPGSQAVQVAKILGWERHRVIGALADLWHNSQAAEAIQGDQASIGLWSTLRRAEDQRRFILALTSCSYLVDLGVQDGVNQWLIVGNEKHVKAKKHTSETQRLRALKRWEEERSKMSKDMPAAYASAVQSSAVQSSAVRGRSPLPPPPEREQAPEGAPPAITEAAHREVEQRPNLPPQTNSLAEITASTIPLDDVIAVVNAYRKAIGKRGISTPLMILDGEKTAARRLIVKCGGDAQLAITIVTAYVASEENPWWKKKNWPLYMLDDERDFETAMRLAGKKQRTAAANQVRTV